MGGGFSMHRIVDPLFNQYLQTRTLWHYIHIFWGIVEANQQGFSGGILVRPALGLRFRSSVSVSRFS
jgi:hypothetical protein